AARNLTDFALFVCSRTGRRSGTGLPTHCSCRVLSEATLNVSRPRIPELCEEVPGSGEGQDVVPHAVVLSIPFDEEALLAAFRMAGQRAVGETEAFDRPVLVD